MSKPTTPTEIVPAATTVLTKQTGQALARRGAAVVDLTTAVREVATAARDYGVTRQEQRTRRQAIASAETVALARISSQRALLAQALDRSFDGREMVLAGLLDRLDRALDADDPAQLALLADALTTIIQDDPLDRAIELLSTHHADPQHVWEL